MAYRQVRPWYSGRGRHRKGTAPASCTSRGRRSSFSVPLRPTTTISSINIGTIDVTKIGADFATLLSRELRRLCRERVDMIYLNIDLADPFAGEAVENAESLGFFLAGWQPLQPSPYTLTLQYANTTKVDFAEVVAEGEQAIWLKKIVAHERERSEKI